MVVTLLRHYKVDYTWKRRYTPEGFRTAWREYDQADVIDQHEQVADFQNVIISNLKRTLQTLEFIRKGNDYQRTSLLDEVPLGPFTDREKRYSVHLLNVRGRVQWLFNSGKQPEKREKSTQRARTFIDEYLKENQNYLIIGHGLFLRVLSYEMLKRGFRGKRIIHFDNGRYFTYELTRP
jgi:broad specificity phosphatase PhoE